MGYSPVQNTSDGKLLGIGFQAFTHGCTTFESEKRTTKLLAFFPKRSRLKNLLSAL